MRMIVLICLLAALAGCATDRAILVNDRGEELTCEARGYGFGGSLATPYKLNDCIAEAEKRGYRLKEPAK